MAQMAMLRCISGKMTTTAERALDRFLPRYEFVERHSISVRASASVVDRAIRDVTLGEMPLAHILFWLRAIPARLFGGRFRAGDTTPPDSGRSHLSGNRDQPLLSGVVDSGFVLLWDTPGVELAVGTIGEFWRASGGVRRFTGADGFLAYREAPGERSAARAVMDFRIVQDSAADVAGPCRVQLLTETRIHVPDAAARHLFSWYWRVVYPGSALIRIVWLRAIKQRAERAALNGVLARA
jgi:hypothetical protein